jgi:pimeloyl-ACP methyl ester carboxylesterase
MLDSTDAAPPSTPAPVVRPRRAGWVRRLVRLLVAVLVLLVLAVAALFVFPLGSSALRTAAPQRLTFEQAVFVGQAAVKHDEADEKVRPECRTRMLAHPAKTAKSVLLLHGYTSCPKDFARLAQLFYDRGYNVYVPREVHHGLVDAGRPPATSQVDSKELVGYADGAMDVVSALGDEAGVVGISGGGVLATWLAEYRTGDVAHLLALSPFYQPDSSQAPGFLIHPAIVLYGRRWVSDRTVGGTSFTFSGLAQYLRIVHNYRDRPVNRSLRSVAVAISDADPYIDRGTARDVPADLARANGLTLRTQVFPASQGLGHNIVDPAALGTRGDEIDALYVSLYEGS